MTENELKKHLLNKYPKESSSCEHKEFKRLKNAMAGRKGEDVISYFSALSNMEGGNLVLGVKDKILKINELSNKLKKICNSSSKSSPIWELCGD